MKSSSHRNTVSFSLLTTVGLIAAASLLGCEKNEAPPPLPVAQTAEPVKVEELKIPDAGAGKEPEDDKKATGGVRRPAGGLAACCAALRQNAANAPPETQGHMLTAAAACDAANKTGSSAGFLGAVGGLLRGAGVPSACR